MSKISPLALSASIGEKFYRLTVVGDRRIGARQHCCVPCRCECGKEVTVAITNLKSGHVKSCGCLKRPHGYASGGKMQPEYYIWTGLKQRCLNPNEPSRANYGGRGIQVSEAWQKSFTQFLADVGNRPSPHHTLDRIDNNGNYEPGNVRWASKKQQGRNKRNNHLLTIRGQSKPVSEWAEIAGIRDTCVLSRLKAGWIPERAVFAPLQHS